MHASQRIKIILIGLVSLLLIMSCLFPLILNMDHQDDRELHDDKNRVWAGSEFRIFNNKVYVAVPSNGMYEVEEADWKTLAPISMEYATRHMAKDQQHVFCGNLILKGLSPNTLVWLGDGYVSDGKKTYHCHPITESNPHLNVGIEVLQIILHPLGLSKKPHSYWYPFAQMEASNQPYKLIANDILSDGLHTYKSGKPIDGIAAEQKIRYLPLYLEDSNQIRLDEHYYQSGDYVFYKTHQLNLKFNNNLRVYRHGNDYYLNDPSIGQFFRADQALPSQNQPYKMLSRLNDHADHLIFESAQGLFAINKKNKKLVRLGDNPFIHQKIELAPDVWVSGNTTYFLGLYEKRKSSRRYNQLCYRSTRLYALENSPQHAWSKISDISNDLWRHGSLWKKGNQYFYFDEQGQGQGFRQAIYLITDPTVVDRLKYSIKGSEIAQILHAGKLKPLDSAEYLQIKQTERFCWANLTD